MDDRDIEVLDLLADVPTLAADSGLGEAGEVGKLEVGVVRGVDVEDDGLVAHVLGVSDPFDRAACDLISNPLKLIKGFLRIKFISSKNNDQCVPLRNLMQPKNNMLMSGLTVDRCHQTYLTKIRQRVTMSVPRGRKE